jgi:hypothetical protein
MSQQLTFAELFASPPNTGVPPHSHPTDDEATMVEAIEEHFGNTEYKLPIKEGSDDMTPLSEREMMFLVSWVSPIAHQS